MDTTRNWWMAVSLCAVGAVCAQGCGGDDGESGSAVLDSLILLEQELSEIQCICEMESGVETSPGWCDPGDPVPEATIDCLKDLASSNARVRSEYECRVRKIEAQNDCFGAESCGSDEFRQCFAAGERCDSATETDEDAIDVCYALGGVGAGDTQ